MIQFQCFSCGRVLKTADDKAGLRARCPDCGADVTVPGPGVEEFDEVELIEPAPPPPGEGKRLCPGCGETIPLLAKTCSFCGKDLAPPDKTRHRSMVDEHRGALIVTLGILSWLVCPICGIAGWHMGWEDLKEMELGRMDPSGRGLTQTGILIAKINIFAWIGAIVLGGAALFAFLVLAGR